MSKSGSSFLLKAALLGLGIATAVSAIRNRRRGKPDDQEESTSEPTYVPDDTVWDWSTSRGEFHTTYTGDGCFAHTRNHDAVDVGMSQFATDPEDGIYVRHYNTRDEYIGWTDLATGERYDAGGQGLGQDACIAFYRRFEDEADDMDPDEDEEDDEHD